TNSAASSPFTVSGTDLINGLTGVVANNIANPGFSTATSPAVLSDGTFGSTAPSWYPINPLAPATTATVTYTLPASAFGYNLTGIDVYGAWNDTGRENPNFSVTYEAYNNPGVFVPL